MKTILFTVILLFAIVSASFAAATYATIAVADTAIGFTTIPTNANIVVCSLETAPVRYRLDGATDPTSSEGHYLNTGEWLRITNRYNIVRFKAIRTTSTSGALKCTFFEE